MRTINFEILGKLVSAKETEKFKPFEEMKVGTKGWVVKRYTFNTSSGSNSFSLRCNDGKFEDESNDIYLFTKGGVDAEGKRVKGEKLVIPFKERFTHPRLSEVADFKKFVFDLEVPNRRWELRKALEKLEDGEEISEETLKKCGVAKKEDLKEALKESELKRHEFITLWDFMDFIKKVIESEEYKDRNFVIKGQEEYTYREDKNVFYRNLVPQKIYLANDNAEHYSQATLDFYFNQASLDSTEVIDSNKYFVNGFVRLYDSNRKEDIPVPYTICFMGAKDDSELEKKKEDVLVKRFTTFDDTWYQYGVVVNMLNGSQREEIKFEDLTEEQQDSILLGELTLEDISRELGGYTYGERITENRFLKPAKGFSKGREETVYSDSDFELIIKNDDVFEEEAELTEDTDDLFDDII